MPYPTTRLSFIKLNVPAMEAALKFYAEGFGFAVTQTFDEPDFIEHIMALPGQEAGPNLLLVQYKDGRDVVVGPGHGPVGFMTDDIAAQFDRLVGAGASPTIPITAMGPVKFAMLLSPQGHELELVQLPA
jgi:lactoylglutathione lyase